MGYLVALIPVFTDNEFNITLKELDNLDQETPMRLIVDNCELGFEVDGGKIIQMPRCS